MASPRQGFARRRKAMGYTQESFAEHLGVERTTITRWETGATAPQPWIRPRIARALRISLDQLDCLLTETNAPDAAANEHLDYAPERAVVNLTDLGSVVYGKAGTEKQWVRDSTTDAMLMDSADESAELRTAGLDAAFSSSIGGTRNHVLYAAHTSALLTAGLETRSVSYGVLSHARGKLAALATAYAVTSDLDPILRKLVVLRDHLAAITTTGHHPREGRDLYQLLGATCSLLASISHDLSEPRAGMTQAETAATFAELSGDRALETWVACTKAMIASWWETPQTVLEHTGRARAASPRGIAAIRLAGLEARALAELGREREAIVIVRAAEKQRERIGGYDEQRELGEVFTFPSERQHYYNATTYQCLGRWKDVQRETNRVVDLYAASPPADTWPVTLTLSRIYQAQARLHLDGPEGAGETLRPVFSIPPGQRLPQTAQALSKLYRSLCTRRFVAVPAASDLREEIVSFQPGLAAAGE